MPRSWSEAVKACKQHPKKTKGALVLLPVRMALPDGPARPHSLPAVVPNTRRTGGSRHWNWGLRRSPQNRCFLRLIGGSQFRGP
jgi:hypothetical protein